MLIRKLAVCFVAVGIFMGGPAMAQKASSKKAKRYAPRVEAVQPHAIRSEADRQRDPLGIIQRQGISSLYGGMGNMGGGSGRSANTGVGLGAHGNSQGPRF
jgi:hypothetical protein